MWCQDFRHEDDKSCRVRSFADLGEKSRRPGHELAGPELLHGAQSSKMDEAVRVKPKAQQRPKDVGDRCEERGASAQGTAGIAVPAQTGCGEQK